MISNTASKCAPMPSRCKTLSAWTVEPLVRISLRPGSFAIAAPIAGFGCSGELVDLVHIGEIVVGAHAMFGHHAAHGGAIAAVVVLLDPARFGGGYLEPGAD